jgi:hypothetical protein
MSMRKLAIAATVVASLVLSVPAADAHGCKRPPNGAHSCA